MAEQQLHQSGSGPLSGMDADETTQDSISGEDSDVSTSGSSRKSSRSRTKVEGKTPRAKSRGQTQDTKRKPVVSTKVTSKRVGKPKGVIVTGIQSKTLSNLDTLSTPQLKKLSEDLAKSTKKAGGRRYQDVRVKGGK